MIEARFSTCPAALTTESMKPILAALLVLSATPLPALAQTRIIPVPTERAIIEAEYARNDSGGVLARAANGSDIKLKVLAIRALGRLENAEHSLIVEQQLGDSNVTVRKEAINALGQMRAHVNWRSVLNQNKDAAVRSTVFETMGRVSPSDSVIENVLVLGLTESDGVAVEGAARGLESYIRRTVRTKRPAPTTLAAIHRAFAQSTSNVTRQLLLLALNSAGNRDSLTLAYALKDKDEQVRRLAVIASRQWVDDPSPIVRWQAMRVAGNCERAYAALSDSSEHVALAAVDVLGEKSCSVDSISNIVRNGRNWRMKSRALVALTRVSPESVKAFLPEFAKHEQWQARAYAVQVARMINDSLTLASLAYDSDPNVASAAIRNVGDAIRALKSNHAGLLLEAVAYIKRSNEVAQTTVELLRTLTRTTESENITYRDVRIAILDAISEAATDTTSLPQLRGMFNDVDPEVAFRAATTVAKLTNLANTQIAPHTLVYTPPALPSEQYMNALRGARATISFKELGEVHVDLLYDQASVTVATFAQIAEAGRFNGLTIHRIVPNFVIQGGSPGANEYDGLTSHFMRDELGFERHMRGTLGISTRGRDTGDGQIFVNLVDNARLNHDYTVFARVTSGMHIIDAVQEGAVIESVVIHRRAAH